MEKENGIILINSEEKVIEGMFNTLKIPVNEKTIIGGKSNKKYCIPTMNGMKIFIGQEVGSHNSGRIKVIDQDLKDKCFKDPRLSYDVFYDNGKVIINGGSKSKLSTKQVKEIEKFYIRNKDAIQKHREDPSNFTEEDLYRSIYNTESEYVKGEW